MVCGGRRHQSIGVAGDERIEHDAVILMKPGPVRLLDVNH
ncbi:MAG: hypothetical protein QOE20_3650, partial [Mycobacterium sp.]|nr:hypothetical protein [Mycobacterium sp.]